MNSKDFVIIELDLMIDAFPEMKVIYEFDEKALVHVVEILPKETYHQDSDYIAWENGFYERFVTAYPDENICFISEDSATGIDCPIYQKEGSAYNGALATTESGGSKANVSRMCVSF